MAKTIIIMRHAATESFSSEGDKKRNLNAKGKQDATEKGKIWMRKKYPIPEKILYSSANRTMQTMSILQKELNIATENCICEDIIYHAFPNDLDRLIQNMDDESIHCIALIGHNNTVTDYLNNKIEHFRIDHLPTAGFVGFHLSIDSWSENTIHIKGNFLFHEI